MAVRAHQLSFACSGYAIDEQIANRARGRWRTLSPPAANRFGLLFSPLSRIVAGMIIGPGRCEA
jgi:hypothetical protein